MSRRTGVPLKDAPPGGKVIGLLRYLFGSFVLFSDCRHYQPLTVKVIATVSFAPGTLQEMEGAAAWL